MAEPIRIELKSIKTNLTMSEETNAYTANLYVDGVFVAVVGNEGRGGADRVYGPGRDKDYGAAMRAYDAADARVKAELPPVDLAAEGEEPNMIENSLELVCGGIVERHLLLKEVAKHTRRNIVLFEKGLPAPGQSAPLVAYRLDDPRQLPAAKARMLTRFPGALILNDLPEDELLTAYKRAA